MKRIVVLFTFLLPLLSFGQSSTYEMIQELKTAERDSNLIDLNLEIGRSYVYTKPDSSVYYVQQALDLAVELENDNKIGESYMVMGSCYVVLGDFKTAISNYEESLVYFKKVENNKGLSGAYMGLGIIYGFQNAFIPSLDYYLKALDLAEEMQDSIRIGQLYNNISIVYMRTEEYEKAIDYYNQSIELGKLIGDTLGIGGSYGNLGLAYTELGEFEKAEEYLFKAVELNTLDEDVLAVAGNYLNLSVLYDRMGKMELAYQYIDLAIKMYEEIGAKSKYGEILIDKSFYLFKDKRFNESIQLAQEGLEIGKENDMLLLQKGAHELLAMNSYELGKYKDAYEHQKAFTTLNDSMLNAENIKQMTVLEMTYDFNKKKLADSLEFAQKEEMAKLEFDKKEAELDKEKSENILLWGGLALVLLASFIVINRIRATERIKGDLINANLERALLREKQMIIDLQLKEKQLTSKSLNLIQKNESLVELKEKLSQLDIDDDTYEKHKRDLQSTINYSFSLDKDWENFKLHFEQVHEGFFDNLKSQYPELTDNQTRLCALIRLKLNIKEAASILNLSPNSVRIARVRLRKKLNLEKEDSLEDLLASI